MNIATQISGPVYPSSTSLLALKSMFAQLGIYVAHSSQDEPFFYATNSNTPWLQYNTELFFYESIAKSAFHILYNDEKIDEETSRQILYAILKNRPIIMTGKLVFSGDVSTFTQELIIKRLQQFHTVELSKLDLTELSRLFSKIKPVDYGLLGSEKILINAQIKAHFRKLLDETKV